MRRIFVTAVLVISMLLLSSCNSSDGLLDEYKQMLESVAQEEQSDPQERFADKVFVVIPEKSSAELSLKARELVEEIVNRTDVPTILKYDNESLYPTDSDLVIFIGNTKYLASEENVKPLKHNDYVCRWYNGEIVLGGRHDEATAKAIDRFVTQILHGASSKCLMQESAGFELFTEYNVSKVMLNGYDLYDYTLVYSASNAFFEKEYAELLRDFITKKSGYFLNVIPDTELDGSVGKTISLKGSAKLTGFSLELKDNDIFIKASDRYAFSTVCLGFMEALFEKEVNKEVTAVVSSFDSNASSKHIGVSRAFSVYNGGDTLNYIADLSKKIYASKSDIIIFDAIAPELFEDLEREKGDYSLFTKNDADGRIYPILYKRDVIESVSLDIFDSVLYVEAKLPTEAEARRLVCPTLNSKPDNRALLEGTGDHGLLVLNGPVGYSTDLLCLKSAEWSFDTHKYSHTLVCKEALALGSESLSLDFGSGSTYANAFVSFSYRFDHCEGFETLKDPLK